MGYKLTLMVNDNSPFAITNIAKAWTMGMFFLTHCTSSTRATSTHVCQIISWSWLKTKYFQNIFKYSLIAFTKMLDFEWIIYLFFLKNSTFLKIIPMTNNGIGMWRIFLKIFILTPLSPLGLGEILNMEGFS